MLAEYNNNVDKENADYAHKCAVLATAKQNLDARHTERITYLDNQLAAREAELATEIRQKQENERLAVTKYNAALEEREVKYQASCARAREYAREAEYDRALEASKLYSELGETGFNNQMSTCHRTGQQFLFQCARHALPDVVAVDKRQFVVTVTRIAALRTVFFRRLSRGATEYLT